MSYLDLFLTHSSIQYAEVGSLYEEEEKLTIEELDEICDRADKVSIETKDTENALISISLRQLSLLLYGAGGGDCWRK